MNPSSTPVKLDSKIHTNTRSNLPPQSLISSILRIRRVYGTEHPYISLQHTLKQFSSRPFPQRKDTTNGNSRIPALLLHKKTICQENPNKKEVQNEGKTNRQNLDVFFHYFSEWCQILLGTSSTWILLDSPSRNHFQSQNTVLSQISHYS